MSAADPTTLSDPFPITPFTAPPDGDVKVPGSKSITNRALVCAALAEGRSELRGALVADDTVAMAGGLAGLGADIALGATTATVGAGGLLDDDAARPIDARQSGTTARFLLPVAALGAGPVTVDGDPQLRSRPMTDVLRAIEALGARIEGANLPATVRGPVVGGEVEVAGDVSSQFLSGLMLAAPVMERGLQIRITTQLVSRPYVEMTAAVMRSFGAVVEVAADRVVVEPGGYRATTYVIEPDASGATYFWALAAMTGGRVRTPGLGRPSLQGDVAFVDVLESMGATVADRDGLEVTGPERLSATSCDLADLSDTAPTFAVVAAVAEGISEATGIGFIRAKESDRIGGVVDELRRCGVAAEATGDGFRIEGAGMPDGKPYELAAGPSGTVVTVETYRDHRMAMAFATLGAVVPGIAVRDPGCVAKTFPGFFAALDSIRP